MTPSHFTNPELSVKLEKIGVESQFDYWWHEDSEGVHLDYGDAAPTNAQQAFHFSDLLLPSEIKKICPHAWDWLEKTILIMRRVQEYEDLKEMSINVDWQSWLSEELDKRK